MGTRRCNMPSRRANNAVVSEKDMAEFREAFELFDTDKSGMIDAVELTFAMKALGFNPTKREVKDMLKEVDTDDNGTVEFGEFVGLLAGKMESKDPAEECQKGFAWFDRDNTGLITVANLKVIATEMGDTDLADNEPELQQMIDELDPTGRGVNFKDFEAVMKRQGVFDY